MLTVEIEHVNCEFLSSLEARGVRVQPSPKTVSVVQDKYAQKQHFEKVRMYVCMYVCKCVCVSFQSIVRRLTFW